MANADCASETTLFTEIEKENAERDNLLKKVEPSDLIQFGMIPVINIQFFFLILYFKQ